MIGWLRAKYVEAKLARMSAITFGNYLKKTEGYFEFIQKAFLSREKLHEELEKVASNSRDKKTAFLAVASVCLLHGKSSEPLIEQYEKRFGSEYLIALELNLKIFLNSLNSPRGGPLQNKMSDIKVRLVANLRAALDFLKKKNQLKGTLSNFADRIFAVSHDDSLTKSLTIAIVLDELHPQRTATLTKMVFDQIAVMLEYTSHNFVIVCSRLHAPNNQFWLMGVEQTRLMPLAEYTDHYDIPLLKYKDRLSMLNLNEMFYGEQAYDKIAVDVFITYPFRHRILEPVLYAMAPVVEIEIMSGISSAANCDVIVPNGVPSENFLKANYAKTVIVQPPRRRFKGGEGKGFSYLKEVSKFVVSASKDFDKRAELDIDLFLQHVAGFLESHAAFSWVFVGGSKDFENNVASKYQPLLDSNRIILVGYEQDLPGLFGLAYLYVQPPMIGGGRAPAIAIENNCPALTFQFGDCTKYMPYQCQRKDYEEMFETVMAVAKDEYKRNELLDICMTVIAPAINVEAAIIYESALRRARIKYIGRKNLGVRQ